MLLAMPPHPSLLDKIQSGELRVPKHDLEITAEELARAGISLARYKPNALARPNVNGPFRVLVILVDFSDKVSQASPVLFDSLEIGRASCRERV